MPSLDWTSISNGSGSYAIIADGTAPSGPDVMQITTGGQSFQNITAGPYKDSRISSWVKQTGSNTLYLSLRSLDNTTFITAPASFFLARIIATDATHFEIFISAVVGGVVTNILNINCPAQNGDPRSTWQQYQFSVLNSGTDMLLRIAQWNGASFIPVADCGAPIASFPTLNASGSCRFGALVTGLTYIDDVKFYSLA